MSYQRRAEGRVPKQARRGVNEDGTQCLRMRGRRPNERVTVAGREFTYTVEREGRWWTGQVPELAGCGSQGYTLTEYREMIADAIESILIVRGEVPEPLAAQAQIP